MTNKSTLFYANILISLIVLVIGITILILIIAPSYASITIGSQKTPIDSISVTDRVILFLIMAPVLFFTLRALMALQRLFANLTSGAFFSIQAENNTRSVSKYLFIAVIATAVNQPVLELAIFGRFHLELGIDFSTIIILLFSLILYLFAQAIADGRGQQDELNEII